jgi:carboxyl-terminal processing protease
MIFRNGYSLPAMRTLFRHWTFFLLCLSACAGTPPTPQPQVTHASPDAPHLIDSPPFAPPAGQPDGAPADSGPGRVQLETREWIFTAAWNAIRDKDFDKAVVDARWEGLRAKYEPLAMAAPDEPTFYRVTNEMLAGLGQSHLQVHGPGEMAEADRPEQPSRASQPGEVPWGPAIGDSGIVIRDIEGRPTVFSVRPGSSAEVAGLHAGYLVTHIGGRSAADVPPSAHVLRPVEARFEIRRHAAHLLSGPVGSRVSVRYLDQDDQPHEVTLTRDAPDRPAVQLPLRGAVVPEVRIRRAGDVGIVAFNHFLLRPILAEVQNAIDSFRRRGCRAIVLDLRGNPGGDAAMAIPIAARLVSREMSLGTIQYRNYTNAFTVAPPLDSKPFAGKVLILTDEGSGSTSELLDAGLQEAKRAVIVGDDTVGAVLGSTFEILPGGATLQIPIAGLKTPKGVAIEGRGVQPDRRVLDTRAALLAGHDPVLDEALRIARSTR